jgi:plasmid maintenance system antidote protein VapI
MKHYTQADLMNDLRARCCATTQKDVAVCLAMPPSFINDVLSGRRNMTDNLARAMGYEPVEKRYEKKAAR